MQISLPFGNLPVRLAQPNDKVYQINQLFFATYRGAYSPNMIVVPGIGNYSLGYSLDNGLTWQYASNNFFTNYCQGVAYSEDQHRWVAVGSGDNGPICYSNDGITWLPITQSFTGVGYDVAYGNGKWVMVGMGSFGTIATSTDGISWTASTNFFSDYGNSVGYSSTQNKWIVTGHGLYSTGYSTDNGVTWTATLNDIFGGLTGFGSYVAFANNRWVITGTNDTTGNNNTISIGYSDDGISWTASASNLYTKGAGLGICYGQGKWIAGGYSATSINNVRPSYSVDNGVTWNFIDEIYPYVGLGFVYVPTTNYFLGFGQTILGESIVISLNGLHWSSNIVISQSGISPKYLSLYLQRYLGNM